MFEKIHSRIEPGDIIDIHVHIGGPPGEDEDMYFWSEKFRKSMAFEGMKLVTRLTESQMTVPRYMSVLFHQLRHSKHVDKIVLLALDAVYSEDGKKDISRTHLFVANEMLAHMTQIYSGFLFGCSVHPYAPDALQRLWQCARCGAVLCKWIPSSQAIDPTHPLSVRFYRALAELGLPLLIHVGPEDAIPSDLSRADQLRVNAAAGKYASNPGDAVAMALEAGATVIVAHCGLPLGNLLDKENAYWEEVFEALLQRVRLGRTDRSLYADISAFCLPGRARYGEKIIPLAKEKPGNFLLGSDYPIPTISSSADNFLEEIGETLGWLAGRALPGNDFDRNYKLLKPSFPAETFSAAVEVLRNPQKRPLPLQRYLSRMGTRKSRSWFLSSR